MTTFGPLPTAADSLVAIAPSAGSGTMDGIERAVRRDGQPSWHVMLYRGGRRLHQHFAHSSFEGEAPALAVARAWRDAVLAVVPPLREQGTPVWRSRVQRPGMPGVYLSKPQRYGTATWQGRVVLPDGRLRSRKFSAGQYGEDEARAMAEAWVLNELALLETDTTPPIRPQPAPEPASLGQEAFYSITRSVSPTTGRATWHVNVIRAARPVQAGFPDVTYGGEAQALAVARAWRDAVMAVMPPLTNIERRQIVRSVRRNGVPGVLHNAARGTWIAVILVGGRLISKSFKIAVHGEENARRLAEAERLRMLDALENGRDPALRSPVALAAAKRDFRSGPARKGTARRKHQPRSVPLNDPVV